MPMTNIAIALIVLIAFFTFLPHRSNGQSDSVHIKIVSEKLLALYTKSLKKEAPLYRGRMYNAYPHKIANGHLYFAEDFFLKGSIMYDGKFYPEANLKYDLLRDQLVLEYQDGYSNVILQTDKVDEFSIINHQFINVKKSFDTATMPNGYYDLLYHSSRIKVFTKRIKTIKETVGNGVVEYNVIPNDTYYVQMDGKINNVKNKGAFIKLLKQNGSQQYLKNKKLDYRTNKENWIIALAKYYDTNRPK